MKTPGEKIQPEKYDTKKEASETKKMPFLKPSVKRLNDILGC